MTFKNILKSKIKLNIFICKQSEQKVFNSAGKSFVIFKDNSAVEKNSTFTPTVADVVLASHPLFEKLRKK